MAAKLRSMLGLAVVAALMGVGPACNDKPPSSENATAPGKQFHARLVEIARTYKADKQPVDFDPRLSLTDCRAPVAFQDYTPSVARISASKDASTHGEKIYFMYAGDKNSYSNLSDKPNPVGQFLVKESWVAEEVKQDDLEKKQAKPAPFVERILTVSKGGRTYHTGKQSDLYIMFKLDPKTSDTDNAWVYGTVTADGKTVTSAGRVASCMACHEKAKHDRLFGLPASVQAEKPKAQGE